MTTQRARKAQFKYHRPEDCRGLSARTSFSPASATPDPQLQALKKIEEAISAAAFPMHNRDYLRAADAISLHLGRDTLAEERQREFDALPEGQQEDIITSGQLGKYGLFHLASRPEVPVALTVAARNAFPNYEIPAHHKKALQDPEMMQKVTARFPAITTEKIQRALG
jgi:hypothetical protein